MAGVSPSREQGPMGRGRRGQRQQAGQILGRLEATCPGPPGGGLPGEQLGQLTQGSGSSVPGEAESARVIPARMSGCPNSNHPCTPWPRRTASPPTTGTGRAATSRWPGRPWSRCCRPSTSTRPRPMPPRRRSRSSSAGRGPGCCRPLLALREHRDRVGRDARTARRSGGDLDRAGDRGPSRTAAPAGELASAAGDRRRLGGRGLVRDPRRPAAGLPHAARPLARAHGDDAADHHPGVARAAGADGRAPRLGTGGAAVQRSVAPVLGRR